MRPVVVLGDAGVEFSWRAFKLRPPTPPEGGGRSTVGAVSFAVSILPLSPKPQCLEEWAEKLVCFRSGGAGGACCTPSVLISMNAPLLEKEPKRNVWKVGFYEAGLVSDAPGRVCRGVSNQ